MLLNWLCDKKYLYMTQENKTYIYYSNWCIKLRFLWFKKTKTLSILFSLELFQLLLCSDAIVIQREKWGNSNCLSCFNSTTSLQYKAVILFQIVFCSFLSSDHWRQVFLWFSLVFGVCSILFLFSLDGYSFWCIKAFSFVSSSS